MSNERNNRLILDNVPYGINFDNYINEVNEKPKDKLKEKGEKNISDTERGFQD